MRPAASRIAIGLLSVQNVVNVQDVIETWTEATDDQGPAISAPSWDPALQAAQETMAGGS